MSVDVAVDGHRVGLDHVRPRARGQPAQPAPRGDGDRTFAARVALALVVGLLDDPVAPVEVRLRLHVEPVVAVRLHGRRPDLLPGLQPLVLHLDDDLAALRWLRDDAAGELDGVFLGHRLLGRRLERDLVLRGLLGTRLTGRRGRHRRREGCAGRRRDGEGRNDGSQRSHDRTSGERASRRTCVGVLGWYEVGCTFRDFGSRGLDNFGESPCEQGVLSVVHEVREHLMHPVRAMFPGRSRSAEAAIADDSLTRHELGSTRPDIQGFPCGQGVLSRRSVGGRCLDCLCPAPTPHLSTWSSVGWTSSRRSVRSSAPSMRRRSSCCGSRG